MSGLVLARELIAKTIDLAGSAPRSLHVRCSVCTCWYDLSALIGWLRQPGSIADKTFAAIIAGGILAAFGGFVGVFVGKMTHVFGNYWRLFLIIVVLVAAVWFLY